MRGILAAGGECCDRVFSQGLELMKLIFAVVHDQDVDALFRALASSGFRATRIASTGGYLRTANATVFIGVEDDEVAHCREIIVKTCQRRVHRLPIDVTDVDQESISPVQRGGGVVFVMPVARFERIAPRAMARAER